MKDQEPCLLVATFQKDSEDIDVFVSIESRSVVIIGISNGVELNPNDKLWAWASKKAHCHLLKLIQSPCTMPPNVRTWDEYDFDKIVKQRRVGDS